MSRSILRKAGLLLFVIGGAASAQEVVYYHTDALGSPVAVTDSSGAVIERSEYEPLGALLNRPLGDEPGYAGHVSDSETGLSYMQQRYFDPGLGLFISVDPVTAYGKPVEQFHRYRYANSNSYKFTDPDGRSAVCDQRSCVIECASAFTCSADYLYVGTVYAGRLLHNAIQNVSPVVQQSEGESPPAPEGLVGTEDGKGGQQGGRVNNGPLAPANGGTGNAEDDFDHLTGGDSSPKPEGSTLPEGSRVGGNGVIYRPPTGKDGPRIDIPSNGDKPHETLHYPQPSGNDSP